jgi:hypothetical protein
LLAATDQGQLRQEHEVNWVVRQRLPVGLVSAGTCLVGTLLIVVHDERFIDLSNLFLGLYCSAHGSSFAYLSPALTLFLPDNSRLCIPYHLSAVLNRYAVSDASTRKDIPGEEERDFLYNPVLGDQEASIRDGMKSGARVFSYLCKVACESTIGIVQCPKGYRSPPRKSL